MAPWIWIVIAAVVVLVTLLLVFRPARTVGGRTVIVKRPRRRWGRGRYV